MPHADSAFVPQGLDKTQFWDHVHGQLVLLLEGQRSWVVNLANAASLVYNALLAYEPHFGSEERAVNWCGFYVQSRLFPRPQFVSKVGGNAEPTFSHLLLAPFCGKPACQLINTEPGKGKGVCADAFMKRQTVLVPDVAAYPGHIACDGETKSELVCPLIPRITENETGPVGVLDLDCLVLSGFTEEDRVGLERIAQTVADACDW